MQKVEINIKEIAKYSALLILLTFVLYRHEAVFEVLGKVFSVLSPFIAGFVIAIFVNVPAKVINGLLEKTPVNKLSDRIQWLLSIALSFIIIIALVALVFGSVLPVAFSSLHTALTQMPDIIDNIIDWVISLDLSFINIDQATIQAIEDFFLKLSNQLLSWFTSSVSSIVSNVVSIISNTVSFVVNLVLSLIFSIYVLIFKKQLRDQTSKLLYAFLKEESAEVVLALAERVNTIFYNFLGSLGVEALIYGLLSFVTMKILRLPYALSISIINAICTFIPYFGAFFGGAIGVILILPQSVKQAFIFLIMTIVLQQFEGNIIYPRVVGERVGLPAIWVMACVSIGGTVAGLPGMILAVPTTTFLYLTLNDIVDHRLMRKNGINVKLSRVLFQTNEVSRGDLDEEEVKNKREEQTDFGRQENDK